MVAFWAILLTRGATEGHGGCGIVEYFVARRLIQVFKDGDALTVKMFISCVTSMLADGL